MDFPVRGRKTVYIYRRRKWEIEGHPGIYMREMEINLEGVKLSPEFAFFLRKKIEKKPNSISEIADYYRLKSNTLYKQYKHVLSDSTSYRAKHAKAFKQQCFIFPDNFGPRMGIDETGLFHGELYTILVNKEKKGKKGCLAAIIKGTAASAVAPAISNAVGIEKLMRIHEMTLDMANSMDWITRQIAPNAIRTYDRFHVEKLVYEALQEVRIKYRWEALDQEQQAERIRILPNGDSRKQLLARSRYLLFKQRQYWTTEQARRASILFSEYRVCKLNCVNGVAIYK